MEAIINLLCLGAMFIIVPVVHPVAGHTWCHSTLCQELGLRRSLRASTSHILYLMQGNADLCFCLSVKHTNDKFDFITSKMLVSKHHGNLK